MRERITKGFVDELMPREKPYDVFDSEVKGFLLRVQPSGTMVYYAAYRLPDGRRGRHRVGPASVLTPSQARESARLALADAVRGSNPNTPKELARGHTLKSFIDEEYKPWALRNLKAGRVTTTRLYSVFGSLLTTKLVDLNTWTIEKWRTNRLADVKPATANGDIRTLHAAVSKAVEWRIIPQVPFTVKALKADTSPNIRYLSSDERKRLMDALDVREKTIREERDSHNRWCCERGYPTWRDLRTVSYADYLKPMVLLSLSTGLRRGETFSLCWGDINFERAVLTVRGDVAKSGQTRQIPLNVTALDLLKNWRKQNEGDELVFPSKEGKGFVTVKTVWKNLMLAAGINRFRWHDMRHDFASQLVMAGVDLNTVRELLGHGDIKITLRYAHLAPEHKAAAVRLLDRQNGPVPSEEENVEERDVS